MVQVANPSFGDMDDLKESLRTFQAALKKGDAVDDQLEIVDAIDAKDSKKLKGILDKSKGAVSAKNLLQQMKNRGYRVNDILKLL